MRKLPKYLGLKILSASVILIPVVFCNKISDLELSKSVSKIENNQLVEYKNNPRDQNQNIEFPIIKNARFKYLPSDEWNKKAAVFRVYWYYWGDDFTQTLREQEVNITDDLIGPLKSKIIGSIDNTSISKFKLKVKPSKNYLLKWDYNPDNGYSKLDASSEIYKNVSEFEYEKDKKENWETAPLLVKRGDITWNDHWGQVQTFTFSNEHTFSIGDLKPSKQFNLEKLEYAGSEKPESGKDIGFLFYKIYLDISESEDIDKKIKVVLKQRTFLTLSDEWGWAADPISTIYLPLNQYLDFYYVAPYTEKDINDFISDFTNEVGANIVIESNDINVYSEANQIKINKIFKQRSDNFYAKHKNSKLGTINKDSITIDYSTILPAYKENTKEAKHKITLKLNSGDTFDPFIKNSEQFGASNINENSISKILTISINFIGNTENAAKKLISIIPYSVAELSNNYFLRENQDFKKAQQLVSSSGPPTNETITFLSSKVLNLNQKKENNDFALIPKNKIDIISRYGLKLNFDLVIESENPDTIVNGRSHYELKYIYNQNSSSFNLKLNPDFAINNNSFSNPELKFNLEFKDNELRFWADKNNSLTIKKPNNNIKNQIINPISLKIQNVSANLPSDQLIKKAKWNFIKHENASEQIPETDTYSTEEPFVFKMLFEPFATNSTAAKYMPFINNKPIGLAINNKTINQTNGHVANQNSEIKYFKSDLAPFLLAQKDKKEVNITIEIKEFNEIANKYDKVCYKLIVQAKVFQDPLAFKLEGWDSQILTEQEKAKYFNIEDKDNYRGDKIDQKTGMYKPKLVWVNSIPPKTFLYDPLDKNGKKLADNSTSKDLDYDIGYLAEINANGFISGDFDSMQTIGGYSINYPKDYTPNGEYPYSEIYNFSKNSKYPIITNESLINSNLVFSSNGLRQTILKKNDSDSFMYQFILSTNQITKLVNNQKEVIDIFEFYKKFKNGKQELIFTDFWDTYHGDNLANYLISIGLISTKAEAIDFSYSEVSNYWSAYVSAMTLESNDNNMQLDLLALRLDKIFLSSPDRNIIIKKVKSEIQKQLNAHSLVSVNENIDYQIEDGEGNPNFSEKISQLVNNYNLKNPAKATVIFNVSSINGSYKLKNNCQFLILNTEHLPFDLNNIDGRLVEFNSEDPRNFGKDKFKFIKETLIYNQIRIELKQKSGLDDLKLGVDYELFFSCKIKNNNGSISTYMYKNIDDAINNGLLINTSDQEFNNSIFVEIKATNTLDSFKLANSYQKEYNNSSANENANWLKESYNISKLSDTLKFNTESVNFPVSDDIEKIQILIQFIKEWVQRRIRNFIWNTNGSEIRIAILDENYSIGTMNLFSTLEDAIYSLFSNIVDSNNFDQTINLEISAINKNPDDIFLQNSFKLKINNSSKNLAFPELDPDYNNNDPNSDNNASDPNSDNNSNNNNNNNDTNSDNNANDPNSDHNSNADSENEYEDQKIPSLNKDEFFDPFANNESFWSKNMIWMLSVASGLVIALITGVSIYKIRKNKKIR